MSGSRSNVIKATGILYFMLGLYVVCGVSDVTPLSDTQLQYILPSNPFKVLDD